LRDEIYTSLSVIAEILEIKSRQAVYKTMGQLEREGLIRRETVSLSDGTKQTLWGITSNGQGWAYNPANGEHICDRVFEASRVGISVLKHTLDLQLLRVLAERGGWSNWVAGDRINRWQKDKKRPDAIANDPSERIIAIEVERSFKSNKRYEVILANYLQQIRQQQIHKVIWVSPTREFSKRLEHIIKEIKEVPVAGQKVKVEPERHHTNIAFIDYSQWPNI
jgi:DNA-binding Lrp family transcriptional regulator